MITATLLNVADSLMPMISRMVSSPTMNIAGRLSTCPGGRPALGEEPPDVDPGVGRRGVDVGRGGVFGRDDDAEVLEERDHVSRPAHRDGGGGEEVLQNQVPADDPGEELAQRRVAVGVGGAGDRDHGGEFGVAQSGEGAGGTGEDEGDHDPRAGVVGGGLPRQHEDARADDRADAEQDQVDRPEHALEAVIRGELGLKRGHILATEEAHEKLECGEEASNSVMRESVNGKQ